MKFRLLRASATPRNHLWRVRLHRLKENHNTFMLISLYNIKNEYLQFLLTSSTYLIILEMNWTVSFISGRDSKKGLVHVKVYACATTESGQHRRMWDTGTRTADYLAQLERGSLSRINCIICMRFSKTLMPLVSSSWPVVPTVSTPSFPLFSISINHESLPRYKKIIMAT